MPFNFRLNVQNVFRRLGIQTGARLPQLADNMQMTMLVTDLSRLVPAPIEPRGYAGAHINSALGLRSSVQLRSLSPGGIFIESLVFRSDYPQGDNFLIGVETTDLALGALPNQNISVGGSPITSVFTGGNGGVVITAATVPASNEFLSVAISAGFFVPNQAFFTVQSSANNRDLDIGIVYRELPSVEEVG